MSTSSPNTAPTYYSILRLPPPTTPPSLQTLRREDVKTAYHRALLHHHPDRAHSLHIPNSVASQSPNLPSNRTIYTIDEIVAAYETLVDSAKRAAYDQTLQRGAGAPQTLLSEKGTHLGVETFDLEDLQHDEGTALWRRECRCGNEEGFEVSEGALERESQHGEIYVGCRGCSLFIKVVFGVAEEEALGDGGEDEVLIM